MPKFTPDYRNIIDAARNREVRRLPLYEHGFDVGVVQTILGQEVRSLQEGSLIDKTEALRRICDFAIIHGYDCIPFERGACSVIQNGQGLMGHGRVLISSMAELEKFPWEEKVHEYIRMFDDGFRALGQTLPPGMKAIGGVGNGIFETVQDFVPYQELAFLQVDEPEVYAKLWEKVGQLHLQLWQWVLDNWADDFAVCRFGDDLGFRSSTLLDPHDIRSHILPHYQRIVDLVHSRNKPFLLHSCGKIHPVMDDLIDQVGIDAKHSNEDAIDLFDVWVDRYGQRIGNFGGVEMNLLTNGTETEVKSYVGALLDRVGKGHGGIAIGSGNQISSYTKPELFIAMTEALREWRGD